MISVIPRKELILGLHFRKLGCCNPVNIQEKNYTTVFYLEFSEFFHNIHKEKLLVNNSENIKYKC